MDTGHYFIIHQQGIDTTMPAGKALFGVMGVFAEFERSISKKGSRCNPIQ
jgi:DNA invertase Pin-like site-specific DNA recombinase